MKTSQYNQIKIDKNFSVHQLLLPLILFLMFVVFCSTKGSLTVFAQTNDRNEKEIRKLNSFDHEPVEIVRSGNSKNLVKLGEIFVQNSDCIKDFTLELKNKSTKSITYLRLELDFPETKLSGNIMSFPITYGISPLTPIKNESVKAIKSEESFKLEIGEPRYKSLKSFIETRHLLDSLSRVDIRIVFAVFDDGTAWSTGHFMKPDPNDPKKYILSEQKGMTN